MEVEPLRITHEEFLKLLRHEIGHGTDGTVCKYDKDTLIKVYHSKIFKILDDLEKMGDEDVKIYTFGTHNSWVEEPITAYFYNEENQEHLKLQSKQAINYAIQKQKNISRTRLPENILYIDNHFAGCVLKRARGIGIHKLSGLSLKRKKIIMHEILESVRELLENNVYPTDLGNSPFAKDSKVTKRDGRQINVGHSHVLVNPFTLKTNIIDLDGTSAYYTNHYNEKYEKYVFIGLCTLLIEFFLQIELDDMLDYEKEIDTLAYYLEIAKVKEEYIEKLSSYDLNIDEIEDVVNSLSR